MRGASEENGPLNRAMLTATNAAFFASGCGSPAQKDIVASA
jgi:hypothetical protein